MKEAFSGNKGALHRQLKIPQDKKIPTTLLQEIKGTPLGQRAHNPTKVGVRNIKVTRLLKQRATPVLTAREVRK